MIMRSLFLRPEIQNQLFIRDTFILHSYTFYETLIKMLTLLIITIFVGLFKITNALKFVIAQL